MTDILRRLGAWLAGHLSAALSLGTVQIAQTYLVECRDALGNLRWAEEVHNLVVTSGLNFILDTVYRGSSYTAALFVGLKGAGAVAAGDTMASHAAWSEVTAYSETTRAALTMAAASAGSCTNSAAKASFTFTGSATVAGAFVATNSAKGGTTGTLVGAGDFAAARGVESGDTLNVTVTATQTAS